MENPSVAGRVLNSPEGPPPEVPSPDPQPEPPLPFPSPPEPPIVDPDFPPPIHSHDPSIRRSDGEGSRSTSSK